MTLTAKFKEDPNEYAGVTIVFTFHFSDGSQMTAYAFGNLFLRVEDGEWFRMQYEEAAELGLLLLHWVEG